MNIPSSIPYIVKKTAIHCSTALPEYKRNSAIPTHPNVVSKKINENTNESFAPINRSVLIKPNDTMDMSKSFIQNNKRMYEETKIEVPPLKSRERKDKFLPPINKNVKQTGNQIKTKVHVKSVDIKRSRRIQKKSEGIKLGQKNLRRKS